MALAVVLATGLATVSTAAAQPVLRASDMRVGSEEERYLRALSALAPADSSKRRRLESWLVRPLAAERAFTALSDVAGPWMLDATAANDGAAFQRADVVATFNSGLPSSEADGPAWTGRGANVRMSGTVLARWGRLNLRFAPMLWAAQNSSFELAPTAGPFPYSDPATPVSIDVPQRFGDGSLARVDAGESTIELRWPNVRLALTSAAAQVGPGVDHSLLLQGNAGGFPRLEFGLPQGIQTPVGRFAVHLAWGRTPHTAWTPDRRTGALFTSYIVGTWLPSFADQLEIGMARLNHRDWERITARELLVPFGSVYSADWVGGSYDTYEDNQIASLFTRFRVPDGGLEFFAEYGKNDRSIDWRDQLIELEHNSAWLLGGQKSWLDGRQRLWALSVTVVNGGIVPIARFRGQAFFYEHTPLTQGHTLRGQLLGTPLLQREGGAEVRLDRWDPAGRIGMSIRTRALPNQLAEAVAPENLRQEWSAAADAMRWTRTGTWSARLGAVADLGHSPVKGDAYSLNLSLGWSRRR